MHSVVTENYLKTIFHLSNEGAGNVNTSAIAQSLDLKAPTVSDMLKKLQDKGYITYQKYKGVSLTPKGKKVAVRTIRKHRIWEVFLLEKLHFKWDEVHDIAEQLEHIHSVELTNRLDEFLGFPKFDPHGDPIPDQHGNIEDNRKMFTISELSENDKGTVTGVNDTSSGFLQYLDARDIKLGNSVVVLEKFDYDGSVKIGIEDKEHIVSRKVAENICLKTP